MSRLLAALALLAALTLANCGAPQRTTRDVARGIEAGVAMGVQLGVHVCSIEARTMKAAGDFAWISLATRCADAYDDAVLALQVADTIVDAWTEASAGRLACALSRAAHGMHVMLDALKAAGLTVSPSVQATFDDATALAQTALRLAGPSGASCAMTDGGLDVAG